MNKRIWKFPVEVVDRFSLELPRDFRILKVANGQMWVEASFETRIREAKVVFAVVGSGRPVPAGFDYIDTYFDGPYVWHLYRQQRNT